MVGAVVAGRGSGTEGLAGAVEVREVTVAATDAVLVSVNDEGVVVVPQAESVVAAVASTSAA